MKFATVMLLGLVLALLAIRWLNIKTKAAIKIGDPILKSSEDLKREGVYL